MKLLLDYWRYLPIAWKITYGIAFVCTIVMTWFLVEALAPSGEH